MSVRRRNVHNRLANDLHAERNAHLLTRLQLRVALGKVDAMTGQRDIIAAQRDRFLELALELGRHFATDPPASLSRNSPLFQLLEEVAPQAIPALPSTLADVLQAFIGVEADQVELADPVARALLVELSGNPK